MMNERLFADADRTQDIAALKEIIENHAKLDTAFREPVSPRAKEVIDSVFSFRDRNGIHLTDRQIAENIAVTRIRFDAIDNQLVPNPLWMEKLAKAGEARANAGGRPVEVACTQAQFENCDRTEEKSHQECYTSPWLRVDVRRDDPRRAARDFSMVTIDPVNVNDTLLRNLALPHLIPAKRSSKAKRMAAYAEAIPHVKKAWAGLETVSLPNEYDDDETIYPRMMRVTEGPHEGMVYGMQRYHSNKETEKGCYLISLDGMYRRNEIHIREQYREEIRSLIKDIKETIVMIDRKVTEEWSQIKDTEELKALTEQIVNIVADLEFVSNEHKVEIRDLMERCANFKTSRKAPAGTEPGPDGKKPERIEVYNPRAMRPMWHKAIREIRKRIDDIGRIRKHIEDDLHPLTVLINEQQAPFDYFYKRAMEKQDVNEILTGEVNRENVRLACRRLRGLKARFAKNKDGKSPVKYQPYMTFAKMLCAHADAAVAALEKEPLDGRTASLEFVRAFWVAKLERFFSDIQSFYGRHLAHGTLPFFKDIPDELKKIRETLQKDRVRPSRKVAAKRVPLPKYNHLLGRMHDLLDELTDKAWEGVEAMNKKKRDEGSARDVHHEMRKLIREFDMVQILNERLDEPLPEQMQVQHELKLEAAQPSRAPRPDNAPRPDLDPTPKT